MGAHMHQKLCGNDVLPIPQPDRLRLSLYPSSLGKFTSSLLPVLAVHTPYSPYRPGIITIGYEVAMLYNCLHERSLINPAVYEFYGNSIVCAKLL